MTLAPLQSCNINFTGLKTPDIDTLKYIKRAADCGVDGIVTKLTSSVKSQAPSALKNINGLEIIPDEKAATKLFKGFSSLLATPLDVLDSIAQKRPSSKLNNLTLLINHRSAKQLDQEKKALQGIYDSGSVFLREIIPSGKQLPGEVCDDYCKKVCASMAKKYNELLNDTMSKTRGLFDTKAERFWTRIVTGFTSAIYMGRDFFNKAVGKGCDTKHAKAEQKKKQKQEMSETAIEAVSQFALFACFSKFVNLKLWAAPLLGVAISLVARIISRISSNTPMRRLEPLKMPKFLTFDGFKEMITQKDKKEAKAGTEKNPKKPLMSLKNILIASFASIAIGFAGKFLKGKIDTTQIGKQFNKIIENFRNKYNAKFVEKIYMAENDAEELSQILHSCGEKSLGQTIATLSAKNKDALGLYIGTKYKTVKLFGKIEVEKRQFTQLPLLPFKMIKTVVSYPYKMANKLYEAIASKGGKANGSKIAKKADVITDEFKIKNIYLQFKDFKAKYKDPEVLTQKFGDYVKKNRLCSLNNQTSSKVENSKTGVLAQVFGTLTGMYFNMTDDYNSTIRAGGTKEEAARDARLRCLNKLGKMGASAAIVSYTNTTFAIQYALSVFYAQIINFISTILVDSTSRVITGMPVKKMNSKEEFEQYQQNHKNGKMAWYYKGLDKLAS